MAALDVEEAGGGGGDDVPVDSGEPSPQSMLAMKSAVVANVLPSVKVATTVVLGSAMPVLGVSRVAAPAVSVGVGDDGRPVDDRDRAAVIGHRDRVGVGSFLGDRCARR